MVMDVIWYRLCKYDLRKGDLFVLSWARVRRVRRGSLSSEMLMCGGGVRSILLLPLVARCLEIIDVCIWRRFVFMSVVVTVRGSVLTFVRLAIIGVGVGPTTTTFYSDPKHISVCNVTHYFFRNVILISFSRTQPQSQC